MSISKRASSISASATLKISARAKKMRQEGIDVIDFGVGEPDFDTPGYIKEAAISAIHNNFTRYTPAAGILELKEAVCRKLKIENDLDYNPNEVIISCGAKHTLFNAIFAMCDEGDEVIVPSPYWVSYPEMVRLSGARPVFVETEESMGFRMRPADFKAAITKKTKALIINSPSNPTGTVYEMEELREIAHIAQANSIQIISDEVYEKLIYEGRTHTSVASLDPRIKGLTITVNGVSKTYAMTGWRIGYAAGPEEIISAMDRIQSHTTSNPTSISQKAALAAILGECKELEVMRKEFDRRRLFMTQGLNEISGITCFTPMGAFYAFPNVSSLLSKRFNGESISSSSRLAGLLLDEAGLAVVPGEEFGQAGFLRLSYATSMDNIAKGLNKLKGFVERLEE